MVSRWSKQRNWVRCIAFDCSLPESICVFNQKKIYRWWTCFNPFHKRVKFNPMNDDRHNIPQAIDSILYNTNTLPLFKPDFIFTQSHSNAVNRLLPHTLFTSNGWIFFIILDDDRWISLHVIHFNEVDSWYAIIIFRLMFHFSFFR